MNNGSASFLQKASFVLLLLILACLVFLIAREFNPRHNAGRSESNEGGDQTPASMPAERSVSVAAPRSETYAPLRSRTETNVMRPAIVPSNPLVRTNIRAEVRRQFDNQAPLVPMTRLDEAPSRETFGGVAGGSSAGSVVGRVVLRGTPPAEVPITLDPACGVLHPTPITTRHFVVSDGGGLANVFVYVRSGAPGVTAADAGPLLDQVGCEYQPYVMGVQVGQRFAVRNSDPLLHNVHSMPVVNKARNIGQPGKGMTTPFVFEQPEVLVKFRCDVHPWMFAYVGVVEHPWFAVTDGNGNFTLPAGLPAGRYSLSAVHLKAGELSQDLVIPSRRAEPVTFTFEVGQRQTRL